MKFLYIVFVFLLHSFLAVYSQNSGRDADMALIKSRLVDIYLLENAEETADEMQKWIDLLNPDGSFSDINYYDPSRASWQPLQHLTRLKGMVVAYKNGKAQQFSNEQFLKKIHSAFNYYVNKKPASLNWWYWQIGVPREISKIMLLMENELDSTQFSKGISLVRPPRFDESQAGQNGVWDASNFIRKGLLLKDEKMVKKGVKMLQRELSVTTWPVGIQPDYSFHQHGHQIYNGSYGLAFTEDIARWMFVLRDTKYAFEKEDVDVFATFMLDGTGWLTYHKLIDFQVQGRTIVRPYSQGQDMKNYEKGLCLLQPIAWMKEVIPEKKDAFAKLEAHIAHDGKGYKGIKGFYHSDFLVGRSSRFYLSLKMCSNRTVGTECMNSENKKGYFLPFGATFIHRTGKEYNDIFPLWNWQRIPGTTLEQNGIVPVFADVLKGNKPYAGMACYKNRGMAAFDYDVQSVKAKKAWYFFDQGMVALGAEIEERADSAVWTTLNQAWARNEIRFDTVGGKITTLDSTFVQSNNMNWVWHDSIGYFFPKATNALIRNEKQAGTWFDVNGAYSKDTVKGEVFTLALDHSERKNNHYIYYVLPGITAYGLEQYSHAPQIDILENTKRIQAVFDRTYGMTAAAFYQRSKLRTQEITLAVSDPCIVFMERNMDELIFAVADPTQKLNEISIGIDLPIHGKNVDFDKKSGYYWIKIKLPTGKSREFSGETQVYSVFIK